MIELIKHIIYTRPILIDVLTFKLITGAQEINGI